MRPADQIPPAVGSGIPVWVQGYHFSVLMKWSIVIAGRVMIWIVPRDPSVTEILTIVSLLGASTMLMKS